MVTLTPLGRWVAAVLLLAVVGSIFVFFEGSAPPIKEDAPVPESPRKVCDQCDGSKKITEACKKCEETGKIKNQEKCQKCDGKGKSPGGSVVRIVSIFLNPLDPPFMPSWNAWKLLKVNCNFCSGTGKVSEDIDCDECNGLKKKNIPCSKCSNSEPFNRG
jgi:RecJ-like exonuclease